MKEQSRVSCAACGSGRASICRCRAVAGMRIVHEHICLRCSKKPLATTMRIEAQVPMRGCPGSDQIARYLKRSVAMIDDHIVEPDTRSVQGVGLGPLMEVLGMRKLRWRLLHDAAITVNAKQHGIEVVFKTDMMTPDEASKGKMAGLILWAPSKDVERIMSQLGEP